MFQYQAPRTVTDLSTCFFYHSMDIPGYGTQKGHWDLRGRFNDYIGNVPAPASGCSTLARRLAF
jgi:hypothetical protein